MYRLLRAIGSLLSRYLNQQTLGAYPHPAVDLALMSQLLKPADVVLVEGKRRISTAIKYLTQSSWSHAAIYVGECGGVDAEGRVRAFVEADMEKGVRAFPIEELEGLHLRIRHYRLFVPRDFDVSPYFTIIKPSLCRDYCSLAWVDADQPIEATHVAAH
jgi:hypothetical protein